jgi:hypothetical protein
MRHRRRRIAQAPKPDAIGGGRGEAVIAAHTCRDVVAEQGAGRAGPVRRDRRDGHGRACLTGTRRSRGRTVHGRVAARTMPALDSRSLLFVMPWTRAGLDTRRAGVTCRTACRCGFSSTRPRRRSQRKPTRAAQPVLSAATQCRSPDTRCNTTLQTHYTPVLMNPLARILNDAATCVASGRRAVDRGAPKRRATQLHRCGPPPRDLRGGGCRRPRSARVAASRARTAWPSSRSRTGITCMDDFP